MLFPLGVAHYVIGGLLVGAGVLLLFILRGGPVGASTAFAAVLAPFSRLPYFKDDRLTAMASSRLRFSLGFIIGAFVVALLADSFFVTQLAWWRLLVGGLLVGFGARMGRGCTSGHGICGIGSRSWQSVLAVVLFTLTAILTVHVLGMLGVVS